MQWPMRMDTPGQQPQMCLFAPYQGPQNWGQQNWGPPNWGQQNWGQYFTSVDNPQTNIFRPQTLREVPTDDIFRELWFRTTMRPENCLFVMPSGTNPVLERPGPLPQHDMRRSQPQVRADDPQNHDLVERMSPARIVHNGYIYKRTHGVNSNGLVGYGCWRRASGCKARLHFHISNHTIEVLNENRHSEACQYTHYQDTADQKRRVSEMRDFVSSLLLSDQFITPRQIYDRIITENFRNQSAGRKAVLISMNQIEYWMREFRGQHNPGLEREVPDPMRIGGKRVWVRSDDRTGIILFMSDLNENFLNEAQIWQIDATFKSCPKDFLQCLNIMGVNLCNRTYLPIAHILMKRRDSGAYRHAIGRFLGEIQHISHLPVKYILIDFEKALSNGIEQLLDNWQLRDKIEIKGCLFHYAQALYGKFRQLYRKADPQRLVILKMFLAFPYLRTGMWQELLMVAKSRNTGCEEFVHYFEKQWAQNSAMWTVPADVNVTTNCALEGFHGNLKHYFQFAHPSTEKLSQLLLEVDTVCYYRLKSDIELGSLKTETELTIDKIRQNLPVLYDKWRTLLCNLPERVIYAQTRPLPVVDGGIISLMPKEETHRLIKESLGLIT